MIPIPDRGFVVRPSVRTGWVQHEIWVLFFHNSFPTRSGKLWCSFGQQALQQYQVYETAIISFVTREAEAMVKSWLMSFLQIRLERRVKSLMCPFLRPLTRLTKVQRFGLVEGAFQSARDKNNEKNLMPQKGNMTSMNINARRIQVCATCG